MHRNSFVALGPISMKSQSDRSFWDDAKQDIKKLFDHFSRLQHRYFLSVRAEGGLGKKELVPANEGKRKYGHKQIKFNIFFSSSSFYLFWDLVFLTYGGHESIKCLFIVWIDIKNLSTTLFLAFHECSSTESDMCLLIRHMSNRAPLKGPWEAKSRHRFCNPYPIDLLALHEPTRDNANSLSKQGPYIASTLWQCRSMNRNWVSLNRFWEAWVKVLHPIELFSSLAVPLIRYWALEIDCAMLAWIAE